jgi:hypothetical protein
MARWRQAVELGMTDEEIATLAAIARLRARRRVGWSGRNATFVFCGGAKTWRPSPDGPTLRGAGNGLWPPGSTR